MSVRPAAVIERSPPPDPAFQTGAGQPRARPERVNDLDRSGGVQVRISGDGRQALVRSRMAPLTLSAIEEELGIESDKLRETEREAYLEELREAREQSTEGTADGILGGIIGYMYDAFQLERPDAGREELERFMSGVDQGLQRGLRDAMDLMRAFATRQDELRVEREEALARVRAGLESFAQREAQPLLGEARAGGKDALSPGSRPE